MLPDGHAPFPLATHMKSRSRSVLAAPGAFHGGLHNNSYMTIIVPSQLQEPTSTLQFCIRLQLRTNVDPVRQ